MSRKKRYDATKQQISRLKGLSMTLEEVLNLVDGRAISNGVDLRQQVHMACGADLMSDVLAFSHAGTLLLTGLTNPQVVRTAEMAGVQAIVFVRGKYPPPETISLAQERNIPLLASRYTMYETCGRLYAAGLESCGVFDLAMKTWQEAFGEGSGSDASAEVRST